MDNNKKAPAKKTKKVIKPIVAASALKRLLTIVIVLVLLIAVGGFFAFRAGVPAMVLTGAEFEVTSENGDSRVIERVKVNELNFQFANMLNQLAQYGQIDPEADLDSKINIGDTEKTIREYAYELTCQTMIRSIQIGKEAKKDKTFKAEGVERSVNLSVEQLRENVDFYSSMHGQVITPDEYLSNIYGPGTTVSAYAKFLERQMIVDEYLQYLEQFVFAPSAEEMSSVTEETAPDAALVTFRFYSFFADYADDATEEEKTAALNEAKNKANVLITRVTDEQSFRDVSEDMAIEADKPNFADGQDPTLAKDMSYDSISQYVNPEMAEYLYSEDRAEGDKTVIETERGAMAVYFVSRSMDTHPSISYREIRLNYAMDYDAEGKATPNNKEEINAKAEKIIGMITDDQSVFSLAKRYSDDYAGTVNGGLVTDYDPDSAFTEETVSEYDRSLLSWLTMPERKAGDTVILESADSARIIYFVDSIPAWKANLRRKTINEKYSEWLKGLEAEGEVTYTIKYGNIELASAR